MKRGYVFLVLALGTFGAVACGLVQRLVITEPVKTSVLDWEYERWFKVADAMDARYGMQLTGDRIVEIVVPVQTCAFSACSGSSEFYYSKPCDQTLGAAARAVGVSKYDGAGKPPGYAGGDSCGNGGGAMEPGVVGYRPIYKTATVAVEGGGSTSQTVLVGYEPIYGMIPANNSISIC